MVNIIYSGKMVDLSGGQLTNERLKENFKDAIEISRKLQANDKKIAYFFIDPLLNHFEAANQFYFGLFECEAIRKINTYKSGASPIQAIADAKELMEAGLYDAVYIFGYEPLLTNKQRLGKDKVAAAMSIFAEQTLIQCYSNMAHLLRKELGLEKEELVSLFDQLFMNYYRTYSRIAKTEVSRQRGRQLDFEQSDIFKLTDCANPNIDFSGGIIIVNDQTADLLEVAAHERIKVAGAAYEMVEGSPEKLATIVGSRENIFPHLRNACLEAQRQANINLAEQYKNNNVYLEVYTCYPPVPIGFLLATEIISDINQLPELLKHKDITITGGMNFARAPWNNPALNGLIDMYQTLKKSKISYGLVHGNGGIGEVQGVAVLEKLK